MLTYEGKYNKAVVMIDAIDEETVKNIYSFLNNPASAGMKIRIMPDCHAGKASVIGFTATMNNYVIAHLVGVDIGCGVEAYRLGGLGTDKLNYAWLDSEIRRCVPIGFGKHNKIQDRIREQLAKRELSYKLQEVIENTNQDKNNVLLSLGTLGGGNHYIEIDQDLNHILWLSIHSGSRNFGLQVANYHQKNAAEQLKKEFNGASAYKDAEYMSMENGGKQYLADMLVAQEYASLNRWLMADAILRQLYGSFGMADKLEKIESIHNYIDFKDNIIRKGAISSYSGHKLVIPLNMRDGVIVGTGKSNSDWNYSAPHGAGRLMSRGRAKRELSMDEYKNTMSNVWSSSVSKDTLDEAPMAYKDMNTILEAIKPTVDVDFVMKPVYNLKA